MKGMLIHCGGNEVTKADLDMIPLPEHTDSYVPVSHYHLTDRLETISQDILTDYTLIGQQYALARSGNQFFGILKFSHNDDNEIGLSLAYRNSYDRSMSIGFAVGASVFVCDNLALTGEIAIMKKHTKNVWQTLEDLAIANIYRSQNNYHQIIADSRSMNGIPIDDLTAFGVMGVLFGKEIISPRQLTTMKDEWLSPRHERFQPRNAWSLYNAATEAMKTTPPISVMEKYLGLHTQFELIIR